MFPSLLQRLRKQRRPKKLLQHPRLRHQAKSSPGWHQGQRKGLTWGSQAIRRHENRRGGLLQRQSRVEKEPLPKPQHFPYSLRERRTNSTRKVLVSLDLYRLTLPPKSALLYRLVYRLLRSTFRGQRCCGKNPGEGKDGEKGGEGGRK